MSGDQDAKGKFQKGNSARVGKPNPNAGRKPSAAKKQLEELIDGAVTEADWSMLFRVLFARACSGDTKAATLILNYKFGRPLERQEISGPDGDPIPIGYRHMTQPSE